MCSGARELRVLLLVEHPGQEVAAASAPEVHPRSCFLISCIAAGSAWSWCRCSAVSAGWSASCCTATTGTTGPGGSPRHMAADHPRRRKRRSGGVLSGLATLRQPRQRRMCSSRSDTSGGHPSAARMSQRLSIGSARASCSISSRQGRQVREGGWSWAQAGRYVYGVGVCGRRGRSRRGRRGVSPRTRTPPRRSRRRAGRLRCASRRPAAAGRVAAPVPWRRVNTAV